MFPRRCAALLRLCYIANKINRQNYLKYTYVTFSNQNKLFVQYPKILFRCYTQASYPSHTKITLPALSPTMEKGTLAKWEKKEGDSVTEGDLLAEIETDKATVGLEASEEGYVAKILVSAGTKDIPLGQLLCIVVADKNDIDAFKNYTGEDQDQTVSPVKTEKLEQPKGEDKAPAMSESHTPTDIPKPLYSGATPYAKTLAAEKGVSLDKIRGTGPDGAILGKDILGSQSAQTFMKSVTPSHQSYVDIDLSNMRQTIAKRLLFSKQSIPHYYLTSEIDMTEIEKIRKRFNKDLDESGVKISVNDFIIKGSAIACLHHRECNSSWMDSQIRQFNTVDVSVAVSTASGLITPIIFNAESKGIQTINHEMKELALKAREGKLKPQEFQGGTFTVSNLGMFGIDNFTAIINPPQSCILSIGTTSKKLIEDDSEKGFRAISIMKVTLGCDHRVVDGAVGALWLKYFKSIMENPVKMLL